MRLRTRMMSSEDQGLFKHLDKAIAELDAALQLGSRMARQAASEDQNQRVGKIQRVIVSVRRAHQMLTTIPRLTPTIDLEDPDLQPEKTKTVRPSVAGEE